MKAPLTFGLIACAGLAASCSDDLESTAEPHAVVGSASATGGALSSGGSNASANGGSAGVPFIPAMGGNSESGGRAATGGASAGGASAGGTAATSGGASTSGRASTSGGKAASATGGVSASGGKASSSSGGAPASGGATGSGGASGSGGMSGGGGAGMPPPGDVAQSGWEVASVSSQETVDEDGAAVNAFDGSTSTKWHTEYGDAGTPEHPHELVIDLGASYALTAFRYTPRQDKDENGMIADYEFYVSDSSTDFGDPVAEGTFGTSREPTTVPFPVKSGRYVRLVALTEINGQKFASVAELGVEGSPL